MPEFAPGDVFVDHRIEGLAGRGGMGVVYRATQLGLDRLVALKVIAPALADEPDFRARFVAESKAAASIEHPNVIPVYYAGEREGVLFIAMRYVDGPDLRALVRAGGVLPAGRAAHIVAQVGSALDAAHERGLVHRDVKPANVLLGPDDHAYLTDFGLTKRAQSVAGLSVTGGWVGTLGYVAPEQIRGDRVDARADVYALGCVLVHALTGHAPYVRDSDEATLWAHLNERPPLDDVPGAFAAIVERALAKDPDDRFPSAGDLGRAALAAAGGAAAPGPERVVARGAAAPGGSPQAAAPPGTADDETHASPGDGDWFEAITPAAGAAAAAGAAGRRTAGTAPAPGGGRGPAAPAPGGGRGPAATTPDLRPAGDAPRDGGGDGRRRGRAGAAGAVGLLALAGAVAAVLLLAGDDGATPERTATTRTAPAGAPVPGEPLLVGRRPNAITFAAGQLWIASSANGDLALVDARLGERTDFVEVGAGATSVDAGSGSVWVAKASTGTLLKIDARTRRRTGPAIRMQAPGRPVAVATGEGAVWVGVRNAALGYRGPESVVRVSPRTGAQQTITVPGGVQDLAVGRGAVWVTNRFRDSVVRISASTGAQREIPVGDTPKGVAVGEDGVWVASEADDVVTRINPRTRRTSRIRLEYSPERVAVGGGSVWVAARAAGRLIRIDPERRRVRGSVRTGRRPFALAVTRDSVWVTLLGEDAVQRVRFRR